MYYQNFDSKITAAYGVIIQGWPLEKFCNPSDIPSRTEVSVLAASLRSNATRFRKLTPTELAEWEAKRFEAQCDAGSPSSTTQNSTVSSTNPPAPSTGTPPPDPAHTSSHSNPSPDTMTPTQTSEDSGLPSKRHKPAPFADFVNFEVSGENGGLVSVGKKARKPRNDKGKKRGPRAK